MIAPHGANFYVHGNLIAQWSRVLAVEISGPMREAETRIIQIKDVDGDLDDETVMRFIEFAYRGDYTVPPAEIVIFSKDVGNDPDNTKVDMDPCVIDEHAADPPPSEPVVESAGDEQQSLEGAGDDWDFKPSSSTRRKNKKKSSYNRWYDEPVPEEITEPWPVEEETMLMAPALPNSKPSKRDVLWSKFCDRASVKKGVTWEPCPNLDPREEYALVFLCHARLYVFSNRYECDTLRDLCLQKLRLTLSRYLLHSRQCPDVTRLVRYAYTHTPDFKQGSDKLRNLVSDYVVCHVEQMCREADFLGMLQECDGLASDLMLKLMSRLD